MSQRKTVEVTHWTHGRPITEQIEELTLTRPTRDMNQTLEDRFTLDRLVRFSKIP